jgi:hypothetical protein
MVNRFASITLVIALMLTLGGTSAFANTFSDPPAKSKDAETPPESGPASGNKTKPPEKLKADILGLITATKAGKVTPRPGSQFPSSKRNNLSTGAKIAIVAVIVVVIVAAVGVHKVRNAL